MTANPALGFVLLAELLVAPTHAFEKVAQWEYDVGFDLACIVPEAVQTEDAVPTAVTEATWGQVNQQGGGW